MNKAILIGRLAKDPEVRTTQNGVSCCTFTVAIDRRFPDQNGNKVADFLQCVAWRERAEFVGKYFTKGRRICVEGSIQTRSYDSQDGGKRYVTEILADNVEFVDSNPNAQNGAPTPPPEPARQNSASAMRGQQQQMNGFTEVDDDELPF